MGEVKVMEVTMAMLETKAMEKMRVRKVHYTKCNCNLMIFLVQGLGQCKTTDINDFFGVYVVKGQCKESFEYKNRVYKACSDVGRPPKSYWCETTHGTKGLCDVPQYENCSECLSILQILYVCK